MPQVNNALSSNFYVILKGEGTSNLEFNLKSINLPPITFGTIEIGRPSTMFKQPGDSLTFDMLDFEVIVDKELRAFTDLYDELIDGSDPESGILKPTNKIFTLTVVLTTNKNNPFMRVLFYGAIINSFGGLQYNTETDELFMTVSADYDYYKLERIT